jgi:hypothetical protein
MKSTFYEHQHVRSGQNLVGPYPKLGLQPIGEQGRRSAMVPGAGATVASWIPSEGQSGMVGERCLGMLEVHGT